MQTIASEFERTPAIRRRPDNSLAHDLRSALFVIDMGARTLAANSGCMTDADRAALGDVVTRGIDRLRELVGPTIDSLELSISVPA